MGPQVDAREMNLLHSATGWGMSGMRGISSSVCVMVSAIL